MNSYRKIDLTTWPRREHYEYFHGFDSSCFNISVKLNAKQIFTFAKSRSESFFLLCLYAILRAANKVPQVKQRIENGDVVEYEQIAAMTPIMTKSEMFKQIWCEYTPDYVSFKEAVTPLVERAKNGEPMPSMNSSHDFICASCLPWLHFESISQAQLNFDQTIPILAWGKMMNGHIPISVQFNHCFLDGLHVARFFTEIQCGFEKPDEL